GPRLDRTGDRLQQALATRISRAGSRLDALGAALDAMSPLRVLARGYAVPRDDAGRVLRRVADFVPGAPFHLTVSDGEVRARTVEEEG
ncbi:MAG TPA: exodeoxyribonuclease VII large subunit, partial [Gemmatimonadales bacterium]|nr:exodeoxyribonuclease VII large subunit [Gemmatimonadales bacterium]